MVGKTLQGILLEEGEGGRMVGKTLQGTLLEEGGEGWWVKHYKGPYWRKGGDGG